jgi:hypothetical protein
MYYSIEKRITARTVYLIVFYISAVLMTAITFYALYLSVVEYASTGKIVIGEILVKTEFPFEGLSKLVTYLMIVSVISGSFARSTLNTSANCVGYSYSFAL